MTIYMWATNSCSNYYYRRQQTWHQKISRQLFVNFPMGKKLATQIDNWLYGSY